MGRNRTMAGLDRKRASKLHSNVERILERAAHGLNALREDDPELLVDMLRKAIVRALNVAADHADGIREAQTLRGAAMLFDGKSIFDRKSKVSKKADLSTVQEAFEELARDVGLNATDREHVEAAFDVLAEALK